MRYLRLNLSRIAIDFRQQKSRSHCDRLFLSPSASASSASGIVTRANGQVGAGDFLAGAVEFGEVGNFVAFARDGVCEHHFGKCVETEALVAAHCETHLPFLGVDMPDRAALFAAFDVAKGLNDGDVVAGFEARLKQGSRSRIQSVERGQKPEFGAGFVSETDPLIRGGEGKTAHHLIGCLFLAIGNEEEARAVLANVNGVRNELVLGDEVYGGDKRRDEIAHGRVLLGGDEGVGNGYKIWFSARANCMSHRWA